LIQQLRVEHLICASLKRGPQPATLFHPGQPAPCSEFSLCQWKRIHPEC